MKCETEWWRLLRKNKRESEKHGSRCWSKRWLIWWHNSEAVSTNSCSCCDEQTQRQDERTCQRAITQKHVPPSLFYAAEVDLLQMTYILMQVKQIQQRKTSWMMQQINLQHCWLITFLWIYFHLSSIYLRILIKFFFWLFVLFLKLQEYLECHESNAQSQKVPSLRANSSNSFNPKQMMEWRSKVRGDRLNWCPVWQKTLTPT